MASIQPGRFAVTQGTASVATQSPSAVPTLDSAPPRAGIPVPVIQVEIASAQPGRFLRTHRDRRADPGAKSLAAEASAPLTAGTAVLVTQVESASSQSGRFVWRKGMAVWVIHPKARAIGP